MTFHSILFKRTEDSIKEETVEVPTFFIDLNLDQIINEITAGRQEYNLKPFFYITLKDIDAIKYRQEIMLDLENETLLENIRSFALKMRTMRRYLALLDKLYYKYHKEGWFLEAAEIYCEAVSCLVHDLNFANFKSRGLLAFYEYLTNYANSDRFTSLLSETKKLKADLSTVKYCVLINGTCVKVRKYQSEIDYSTEVEKTFEKFKQGAVKDYRVKLSPASGMNHVEAKILDLVAKLYPDIFLNLDNYCTKNVNFLDETIAVFDREIQFYVAYLEHIAKFKRAGLKFCYPRFSNKSKEVYDYEGFDLALTNKLITENSSIVCNDFYLKGKERIFVVSGPNQGGKTTFARTFGQLHYLASLGCPIPGREAQFFLFDRIFTHFEKEENIKNLRGKLQDDLVRIHHILNQATSNSIIIINEIFTSTTLKDAIVLGKSEGFVAFFAMLNKELDDEYFDSVQNHLKELKFRDGVLISAELGKGNEGTNYILRKPQDKNQSWVKRIFAPKQLVYTFYISDRDESGSRILSELRDRGINLVANALAQSADHINSFFNMLRTELAFYIGCLNLYEQLAQIGEPISFPLPVSPGERRHSFKGLYDVCLALTIKQKIVGNNVNADNKNLVIITGANQGGKSTFLRSIGLSQLMMQCGMFVPAESFCYNICDGLFTHYKREEDATMKSGKLDEELSRMSDIVDNITSNSMLLFNESFAATNEREGSEIAR